MKTWITSALLAASALVPAIASAQQAPDDRHGGDQRGAGPQGQPGPRPDRQHGPRAGGPQPGGVGVQAQVQGGAEFQQRGSGQPGRPNFGPGAHGGQGGYAGRGDQNRPNFGPGDHGGQGGYAGRGDQGRPNFGPGDHGGQGGYVGRGDQGRPNFGPGDHGGQGGYAGRGDRDRPNFGPGDRGNYGGPQRGGPGGYVGRDDGRGGWNRGWRGDNRYNWGGYRAQNRSVFRLPRYYAPPSWHGGYRRFSVGVTLGYGLFGGNYWIGNPYAYRLPPAHGPYRWVRYYNDALLVDTRSGYVVDAVYDIFW